MNSSSSAAKSLTARILAVRAEIRDLMADPRYADRPAVRAAMKRALERTLTELEVRLGEVI